MNIKALEYFIKLAECHNFSKAARELYITQTALSKTITGLEKELGKPLLIRGKSAVTLSEAGTVYLNYAKKTVQLYQKSQQIIEASLLEHGTLRIGVTELNDSLISALGLLHQKYPGAQFRLYSNQLSAEAFSASKLDMIMLDEKETNGLHYVTVAARKGLYAIMNAEHRLAKNKVLDFADLENEDLVFSIGENGKLDAAYDYCIQSGFCPKTTFLYNDSKYQIDIILNSSAIAVSFNLFRRFRDTMDSIVSIPIHMERTINDRLVLAYRPDNKNPLVEELVHCIEEFKARRTQG